jgi:hypothetical protein
VTGDEHYQYAERVLAGRVGHLGTFGCKTTAEAVALAQVHATLAVAAATFDAAFVSKPTWTREDAGYGR